jgi:ATP-dependent Clp protease ATP-binding subunit ClpC
VDALLKELLDRARSGEEGPFQDLLRALRSASPTPADLIAYARAEDHVLRRAAVALATEDPPTPELLTALGTLAEDAYHPVRQAVADALAALPWPLDDAVRRLLRDQDSGVREAAVRAAARRADLAPLLPERLRDDSHWLVRRAAASALAGHGPDALPVLLETLAEDGDTDVVSACASSLEALLGSLGAYPDGVARPRLAQLREARQRVGGLRGLSCPRLAAWLEERVENDLDLEALRTFGTLLTADAEAGRLPHAFGLDEKIDAVIAALQGGGPRAVVLLGESGVGKTALVNELAYRLLRQPGGPWHVLQVSPSEFLAGAVHLGEWETKLRQLVQAVRRPRRVVLYVPNLEELASVGAHSKSDSNVASALAPHLERGDVALLGESTDEAFRAGLGAVRALRRLFHPVELTPTDAADTRSVLRAVVAENGASVPDPLLERLVELADFYSSGAAQPGRAVGLLRRLLAAPGALSERAILSTVSTSTGIPIDFLDDGVPLDRGKVRAFFEARVMGQPEAVDAVVDLVTLVKAGLTDPLKPFGVLFFVGPTGVGKTELARALAELLFGDAARLVRLDMSEYAAYDAAEKLLGRGHNPGVLTAAVRDRPFSVLLFDEIEKAHAAVFDLCLQLFDAGRLTDAQGRTADFRRAIIILTSNVGAQVGKDAPVGFGRAAPPPDPDLTLRELGRVFRPEFLNRLDRVVNFRPLSMDTAEKIARRELAHVMERGGIARRRLMVDVGPEVLPLLLREGYSRAFGARPLKRTVERLVLLPLARAIASGEAAPGSVLRLSAAGGRIEVAVAAPEPSEIVVVAAPPPGPAAGRAERLAAEAGRLRDAAAGLAERKTQLLLRAAAPGFWDDRPAAQATLDEVFRIDGVLAAVADLERAAGETAEAAETTRAERDLERLDERLAALEGQSRHVAFLVGCRDAADLGDAFVVLTRLGGRGAGLDGVGRLARMYVRLAQRHRLHVVVLDDRRGGEPPEDVAALQLTGAGAFALLAGEAGLHQLTHGDGRRGEGHKEREVVRVEVFRVPPDGPPDEVRAEVRPLDGVRGRLGTRPRLEVVLRHGPSLATLRAWSDRPRADAVATLRPLLLARVAATRQGVEAPKVVRRYALGRARLVRDARSGRSTGRLDQVLDGQLDAFLRPPKGAEGPGR